jgi:T-complex protein 1 subunit gamma
VKKIGDEFFSYFIKCTDPKACTIILRGASKDVLNEIERNLQVLDYFFSAVYLFCIIIIIF